MRGLGYAEYIKKYARVQKNFIFPIELDYWLRNTAEEEGTSYSALVRSILEDYKKVRSE